MERMLSPEEVAEKLQIKEDTIRRWLRSGTLKGIKISRFWRIREEDLQDFIKELMRGQENL